MPPGNKEVLHCLRRQDAEVTTSTPTACLSIHTHELRRPSNYMWRAYSQALPPQKARPKLPTAAPRYAIETARRSCTVEPRPPPSWHSQLRRSPHAMPAQAPRLRYNGTPLPPPHRGGRGAQDVPCTGHEASIEPPIAIYVFTHA